MDRIRSFFIGMIVKVRAAFITAGILGVAAAVDYLAGFDWIGALGPWAAPVGAIIVWFSAYWKKEHPEAS